MAMINYFKNSSTIYLDSYIFVPMWVNIHLKTVRYSQIELSLWNLFELSVSLAAKGSITLNCL